MSYFIILRGPLGSGNSTIAEKLAETLGGDHIEIDKTLEVKANELILPEVKRKLKNT